VNISILNRPTSNRSIRDEFLRRRPLFKKPAGVAAVGLLHPHWPDLAGDQGPVRVISTPNPGKDL
jgi:hypothetical protein